MDEIKAELSARLPSGVAFEIPLFGGIPVPQSTVMTWIIIGVITVLCIWLTHNLKERPGRRQMVAEVLVGFINNFCKENLGKHWRTFAPYLGTVAVYLVVSNTCGLFGFTPPTKDLNVAAALAIMSGVLIYAAQFKYHGFRGGDEEVRLPLGDDCPAERHGNRHPAAVPVLPVVRQHLGGLYHHGADQNRLPLGAAHPL